MQYQLKVKWRDERYVELEGLMSTSICIDLQIYDKYNVSEDFRKIVSRLLYLYIVKTPFDVENLYVYLSLLLSDSQFHFLNVNIS